MGKSVKSIPASLFKAKCLALLDEVSKTGLPMIVTKRGKPVAKVIPVQSKKEPNLLGSVHYKNEEDLLAPVDELWEADA